MPNPLTLGARLPSGERVGYCPMCGKRGKIAVSLIDDAAFTLPLMYVKVTHRQLDQNNEPVQCARRYTRPLLVNEAARLCGVQPITIRAAERRGLLKSTRRPGYPIEFTVADFAEYFNRADGRHNRRRKEARHES
jgi:hypothetical protein